VSDEPVPKLPRGRGIKLSGPTLFRVVMMSIALIGVIFLARPCANSVSSFVMGFDPGSAGSAKPKPDKVAPPTPQYEELRPGMTEQEIKAAIERSKARAAGSAGSAR
jgi:hypothetical protein